MPRIKKRDPYFIEMINKKSGAHESKKYSRKTKHKGKERKEHEREYERNTSSD